MDKKRLGKGLDALISRDSEESSGRNHAIEKIYLENIVPNPFQPRKDFDRESLEELASSIESNGVIQPITVRQIEPEKYQLVSGERRWRAAKLINLKKIPAIIDEFSDHQMMEVALIENLQREDLNPIEEAQAYKKMLEDFNMTQKEVAEKVGKSRSSIANSVRLLNLAPKVQMYVSRETLSMGHARSLLALGNNDIQVEAADYVIKNHLSVRETEKYVSQLKENTEESKNENEKSKSKEKLPEHWIQAQRRLSRYLGKKVKIKTGKNKKVVSIELKNFEDLESLMNKIK